MKVFVSYCHQQANWVLENLLPVLDASGWEVLIDRRHFMANHEPVIGQMDTLQDQADQQILVTSPLYLTRPDCLHEMDRAQRAKVTLIKLAACDLPSPFDNLLYLDFYTPEKEAASWETFARTLGIDWDVPIGAWLEARRRIKKYLENNESVNLISRSRTKDLLIDSLVNEADLRLKALDFQAGNMTTRKGVVANILKQAGISAAPSQEEALTVLADRLTGQKVVFRQVWQHFHWAMGKAATGPVNAKADFNGDFFAAIRTLTVGAQRRLVLLMVSSEAVEPWMQQTYGLSAADFKTLWLR